MKTLDPFTLEIIKESLTAIGDEMFIALGRTSKSPIIYEVLDYACGLTDARGQLVAQGEGVTGFLGTLSSTVKHVLEKFGPESLRPGDVIIDNDPYVGGGTHLSDVGLVMPIFYEGRLVAFGANKAHWTEVGGKDPGSWTTDATEVYQEGLQFPCLKLYEGGKINQSIVDIIEANVRTPDMTLGDMYAQAASLRVGERRTQELCAKYGLQTVLSGMERLLDYGEEMVRAQLHRLPQGVYQATNLIDDDGMGHGPLEVRVAVTITGEDFICDFSGSHPQVPGPINCTRPGLESSVRTIFKALTDPTIPANEGCFRPLKIICPEGTIFTAIRPAPVSTYWETAEYVTDLVWKALSPLAPERLTAGHFLSVCGIVLVGRHPDTGELCLLVEPQAGGWGAGTTKDGENGLVCSGDGETYVIPVEVAEMRYGLLVERYTFNPARGGAGRYRGGRGLVREYRILSEEATLTATFGRFKYPPWGMAGGHDGSINYVEVVHADG
ncbi:MAG: hydantoinase B/oxoprolinase family protein, partial [Anaerolineae bacterium]